MAQPRKLYRVERPVAGRPDAEHARSRHREIGGGDGADDGQARAGAATRISRMHHELRAIVSGTEQAAQDILAAAEAIDLTAKKLSSALRDKAERKMARDIEDLIIRIFEACNFQDLIGQRVAKVAGAMKFVEGRMAQVSEAMRMPAATPESLHGPRLEGDEGHSLQADIDAIFVSRR